jgi:crotonobetainyl-CoA:carnitine CoA-transferase CaiB-like acyl-CoA transferase
MTNLQQNPAPLSGMTVIELGHSVAAPFAGQILADLGARVIKIENPSGGDDARHWGPPFWHGAASAFQSLNRNKISVTVNLKNDEERKKLKSLMLRADIIVQNMRPGLVERYGLGSEQLLEANNKLIYCNLGAFGNVGPLKDKTGYDPLVQAFSGIMSVTGEPERPPVRVGPSIIDQGAGMWCVIGILAALMQRSSTGQGGTVDTSLYETALSWMTIPIASALASGKDPGKSGSETPMLAPYRAFQAADRYVVIAAGNNNLFARLVTVLGHPEWAEDSRFIENRDRIKNRVELNSAIEAIIRTMPASDWVEALDAVGVPCSPVQSVSEVLAHSQTSELGMLPHTPDGKMQLVATPLRFNGIRPEVRNSPPALGHQSLEQLIGLTTGN